MTNEIGLHDCTPAIIGLYSIGYDHGRQSMLPELERAQDDRDALYERCYNPGSKLADVRLRRMRAAAEEYWAEFVAQAAAEQAATEGRDE
ncbi:hypothetical protein G3T36_17290 [Diaminobutyricibacter tongyongensis]|uniref:Uncharacterized protein n=1 Tax=Leifsonia tongyongensis TaxID=1268043 RepID=A0A6L9Y2W6_9MICO|nr:hypothetical protein [Diaminobutyricibacter tongyongensis]NEN07614.1 hypothetical protein [Diaminobutyricibacter tongyongensis]